MVFLFRIRAFTLFCTAAITSSGVVFAQVDQSDTCLDATGSIACPSEPMQNRAINPSLSQLFESNRTILESQPWPASRGSEEFPSIPHLNTGLCQNSPLVPPPLIQPCSRSPLVVQHSSINQCEEGSLALRGLQLARTETTDRTTGAAAPRLAALFGLGSGLRTLPCPPTNIIIHRTDSSFGRSFRLLSSPYVCRNSSGGQRVSVENLPPRWQQAIIGFTSDLDADSRPICPDRQRGRAPTRQLRSSATCHFLVEPSGTIHQIRPLDQVGRHAWRWNLDSLCIENVGNENSDLDSGLTRQQVEANSRIIRYVTSVYPSIRNVLGHSEASLYESNRGRAPEPGARFMAALRTELGSNLSNTQAEGVCAAYDQQYMPSPRGAIPVGTIQLRLNCPGRALPESTLPENNLQDACDAYRQTECQIGPRGLMHSCP